MPPMLSDDESMGDDVPDMIPAKGKAKQPEVEQEEEDGDDDDADEYRVEKILGHDFFAKGEVRYQIKWLGYEDEDDLTWEPEENLDGAQELLDAYFAKIGGKPEAPTKGKKKGRASVGKRTASEAFDSSAPASSTKKKGRKSNGVADEPSGKRELPIGSWEDHVLRVTSIIEESAPAKSGRKATEQKELIGLLEWKDDGPKTQHKMKVLRQKVPQKLLDYYEQHLVFTQSNDDAPGEVGEGAEMPIDDE